jgi:GMP synthase (glutamine-hydrolysing)
MTDRILIIDFGSQVTQLIARRVRESGVYSEIHPFNSITDAFLDEYAPKAIILSGGPASVTWEESPRAPEKVFEMGIPVLGICYGQQTMMEQLGGKVETSDHHEFGRAFVDVNKECSIFKGIWEVGAKEQVRALKLLQHQKAHRSPPLPTKKRNSTPYSSTRKSSTRRMAHN